MNQSLWIKIITSWAVGILYTWTVCHFPLSAIAMFSHSAVFRVSQLIAPKILTNRDFS
jgi:hypothetical protein